jgi:DNA-binding MarR family transcriptional regulator
MTAALDRLERAGYVRRVRGETDRRRVRVEVTSRALGLTEAIWGPIGAEGIDQLRQMSVEELRFLAEFLRRGRELQERHTRRIATLDEGASDPKRGTTSHPSARPR